MAYTLKTNIANKSNYGNKRSLSSIKYIAIHYTGNDGDTDENNGKYFKNNIVKASAHYFVDDDSVTQSVPDDYVAWSVGGGKYNNNGGKLYGIATNTNTLNIEICDDIKNGVVYPSVATIENVIAFTKAKMKEYNIPKENVIRHYDVNSKRCPSYWCGNATNDAKWKSEFWNKLSDNTYISVSTPSTSSSRSYLMKGDEGESVKEMQEKLIKLGYSCGSYGADGDFGSSTYNAVIKFQKDNNLTVDGKFGEKSKAKADELIENMNKPKPTHKPVVENKLEVGSTVSAIQRWLNKYYYAGLSVDGVFGKNTKKALVKAWQKEVGGLSVDGVFGAKSKDASSKNVIRKGSDGILVTIWQAYLVCRGYNPNGIDGDFGGGCYNATVSFQKKNGLTGDGIVGKGTWTKAFA